ncbi:unnamed protein product [Clonostachys solani]|uniref:Uncharacterized protein n=1 Tax=Clonostachys solani TaxID=160281 RepID=A0A9N9ZEW4_9HYPO|nr:unnamed protein product [Clonostachys solani]
MNNYIQDSPAKHLRKSEAAVCRIVCLECKAKLDSNLEGFKVHVRDNASEYSYLTSDTAIADAFRWISLISPHTSIAPQPETKPISYEQLVAEVKGIYAGLVMIETKCIKVNNA